MIKVGALGVTRLHWIKSSYSGTSGNCVEVADLDSDRCAVRDSKNPPGPILIFPMAGWSAFTSAVRTGEYA